MQILHHFADTFPEQFHKSDITLQFNIICNTCKIEEAF